MSGRPKLSIGYDMSPIFGYRCISVSKVRLALPSGGEALVEARSHVTQYGVMMSGRVERDGQLIFERRWLK